MICGFTCALPTKLGIVNTGYHPRWFVYFEHLTPGRNWAALFCFGPKRIILHKEAKLNLNKYH